MSRASAGGTATRRAPRLGCLTASSPARRRPLLIGIWGFVVVMSGSGPIHRRCLTMLIDAVHGSRSAPSTEWRTTPTGRDVTALRFSGPFCVVNPHNAADRASSALALRLRCGSCCGSDRAGHGVAPFQLSSRGKLTNRGYGLGGTVVSAPSTQARKVPPMLAMWTGVACSTSSWQRCPPQPIVRDQSCLTGCWLDAATGRS